MVKWFWSVAFVFFGVCSAQAQIDTAGSFRGQAATLEQNNQAYPTVVSPARPASSSAPVSSDFAIDNQDIDEEAPLPASAPQMPYFQPKEKPFVPQIDRPTLDGVERGRVSIKPVVTDENKDVVKDDELIFVYYKDFKISKMVGGDVYCNVTFAVLTTLNRRMANLSAKLKWPNMLTTINFVDVDPNTETIFNYVLLGEGCYSMDSIPNIIVNRCRVKDLTQQQCAAKIRWLRK